MVLPDRKPFTTPSKRIDVTSPRTPFAVAWQVPSHNWTLSVGNIAME